MKTCIGCGVELTAANWTSTTKHAKCRICYHDAMARHNSISALADTLAGSRLAFRALSRPERLKLRAQAREQLSTPKADDKWLEIPKPGQPALPAPVRAPRPFPKRFGAAQKQGYVYPAINPAFPGLVKIGHCGNLKQRQGQYNTYDPYRRYVIIGWVRLLSAPLHE